MDRVPVEALAAPSTTVTAPMPIPGESSATIIIAPALALLTFEGVLDELMAGKITRNEAATRIHEITNTVKG